MLIVWLIRYQITKRPLITHFNSQEEIENSFTYLPLTKEQNEKHLSQFQVPGIDLLILLFILYNILKIVKQ